MPNDFTRFASEAERKAVTALVDTLLAAGVEVRVHDGEEWASELTTNRHEAFNACASTGFDLIVAWRRNNTVLTRVGGFSIIYQSATAADEVIYDYTDNEFCRGIMHTVGQELGENA